jgi:hypothetical protein
VGTSLFHWPQQCRGLSGNCLWDRRRQPDKQVVQQCGRKIQGMSRGRAAAAVQSVKDGGLVRVDEAGSRPRYYLLPAHVIPGCEGHPPTLSVEEQALLGEMDPEYTYRFSNRRSRRRDQSDLQLARSLTLKGLVSQDTEGRFSVQPYDAAKAAEPDWIWLPNTIVTGATNETPPVALLRQAQSPAALRLFVDCYHSHGLAEDGGIHWRRIRRAFTRHRIGERGPYVVWGFQAGSDVTWSSSPFVAAHLTGKTKSVTNADGLTFPQDTGFPAFWEAWHLLKDLGLMETVPHIVEADNDVAEIVHPYAIGNGEPGEQEVASVAHAAGASLLTPSQIEWARDRSLWLLPTLSGRLPNAQMVGIARLRYRPHTKATAAWIAKKEEWAEWTRRYSSIAASG